MKRVSFLLSFALSASAFLFAKTDITPVGPYGGDVRSLAVHPSRPDVFFLGTADGQIYMSRNAGETWNKLVPGLERRNLVVDNLVFDPRDPNTLYAATWELKGNKGWLFRTRNAGESWESIPLGLFQSSIRAIALSPSDPDVIAVGISEGVLLSKDRGKSWDRISRGYRDLYNVESLAFDSNDSQTLYVGTWHLGWKTIDGGKKWQPIHAGMVNDSDMFALLVHPEKPGVLYASACTGIYKSDNSGQLWTKLRDGLPKEAKRARTLHLDPANPNTVYAGTTVGLFVSTDQGSGWRRLVADVVVNAVAVHPQNNQVILVGTDDAGVLRSPDAGKTFNRANHGFSHRQISSLAFDPTQPHRYYASVLFDAHHGGFFVSSDRGTQWQSYNDGLEAAVSDIRAILPARLSQTVFLATSRGLFRGVPPQAPWQPIESTRKLLIQDITFSDHTESGLFLATRSGIFYLDLKQLKLQKLVIPVYDGPVSTVFYDRSMNLLFAGADIGVFRSGDRGRTWSIKVKGLPYTPINVVEKIGKRLFCGARSGLFASEDNGETWIPCKGVYPIDVVAITANPVAQQRLIAGDFLVGYLFQSEDGGLTWSVLNSEGSRSRIASLMYGPSGDLLAGTVSDGIYLIQAVESATVAGQQ